MTWTLALLMLASAAFYTAAMVAMKFWGSGPTAPIFAAIAIGMVAAVVLEIFALRTERLGLVYIGILGAEVVMIALASHWIFGESFTSREVVGASLVVVGTALAWA